MLDELESRTCLEVGTSLKCTHDTWKKRKPHVLWLDDMYRIPCHVPDPVFGGIEFVVPGAV